MKLLLKYRKYLTVLFWLGPCLLVMGGSAGLVAGSWGAIPIGLMLGGGTIVTLWLVLQTMASPQFWGRRSTLAGTNAIVATLALLVILGLVNSLAVRFPMRVDLTESKVFTLAPQSIQVLQRLKRPVKVVVFGSEPDPRVRALLEEYDRQDRANRFSFTFVNPQAQPQMAAEFELNEQANEGVYLQSGARKQFVQSLRMEPLSEGRLTNQMEQIATDTTTKVYFLQGHGEAQPQPGQGGYSQAAALLAEKNLTVELLNLAQQPQVPREAAVVVVAGPSQPLQTGEVKALEAYLDRGGSLLLLLDPKANVKLDPLLKTWGVILDDRLAVNASRQQAAGFGPAASVINQYGDHPITKAFRNSFSIYPFARPLELTPVPEVQQIPLLITGEQTWAESDLKNPKLELNPQAGDRPGPLLLGVALSRPASVLVPSPQQTATPAPTPRPGSTPVPAGALPWNVTADRGPTQAPEARIVVIGNSSFAADGLFGQYVNGDLFLNAVSWLSKRDDPVLSISPKDVKNRRIVLTWGQTSLLYLLVLGVLPLLGFSTAAIVWWQRR
ncbi:hypothetical protein BST81_17645 [Leptolyngbya sp. 'hensonii']|uniref:GldG family protein n=1 Tax=Leptolyngbya sp. 'hensonii' TaxID=1922337 RepID=UPI00094F79F5|nr:Gldg family protein [Leptolyngbya sp. 'hensonii']OLP17173.1 hypothetical protein BST81_17645 [Leptolyngbya sp. 'hensonii']